MVLNPAAILVEPGAELDRLFHVWTLSLAQQRRLRASGGACVMLYRAQGHVDPDKGHAPSYLGLAVFTRALELVERWSEPGIRPTAPFHNLGVEDPRCTKVGDLYYLYYTGYGAPPGVPQAALRVQICLATTRDFLHWQFHGPVAGGLNDVNNKNAALLPEPVGGRWMLLHRPMEGPDAMAIHLAEADDPAGPWTSRGMMMKSYRYREFKRSWIGAGGPPLALGDGRFLMIYHQGHMTAAGAREYDLAAALLDFNYAPVVRSRIEPLMRPSGAAERVGDGELGVDNVLFTCANYVCNGDVVVPYAGADSRIFGARVPQQELVNALEAGTKPTFLTRTG